MNDKTHNSKLIQRDDATEKCYEMDKFDPKTESLNYSYTSARVMKPVYNTYKKQDKPKVFGYYTDWSQYDGRLDNLFDKNQRGAGYDLAHLSPTAFDKIVFGFVGVVGDKGEKAWAIADAAAKLNKVQDEPTFLDPWGDFDSHRNCALIQQVAKVEYNLITQENSNGILGGLRDLQKRAKDVGHELVLSMSIGGWTMSHAFHELAKKSASRTTFALGIVKLFKQFPMFTEVDIDWEYPGDKGNENPFGPEDGANYVLLMKELKTQFKVAGLAHVKISIAAAATVEKIQHCKIKELLEAGLHGINLMTYDCFGTPWAEQISHHTNLMPTKIKGDSVDTLVNYLIEQGVAPENINIGYAGYSRNAHQAEIESISPLKGSYNRLAKKIIGTLESGTSVWADIIYNYLDLENQCGRNGFDLYTDQVADADYLYNKESKLFMSIDTPRTVKAKGEYAAKHNLGGVFTWTIDQDNGVLVNAAREGLGYEIENQVIDMKPFYFEGINVKETSKPDEETTKPDEETKPVDDIKPIDESKPVEEVIKPFVKGTVELTVIGGASVQLAATGYEGAELFYRWIKPQDIVTTERDAQVIEVKTPVVTTATQLSFQLQVKDIKNRDSHTQMFVINVVKSMAEIPVDDKQVDDKSAPKPSGDTPAWNPAGKVYKLGDNVMQGGLKYRCISAHTSNSGWNPKEAFVLWQLVA